MFSQNVFSARDVQVNSALSENAWDSQQYSQVMYSSQNSQLSSMELFSQQKGSIPSSIPTKYDQYDRSQSQTTEDENPNYFSKYVNNTPLFPSSSKNKKVTTSMQAFIEEEKKIISMKEERDMLQTFINLLKDYTKEVDCSFKNFKNDMENTLQAIIQNMQDGTQRIDDKVMNVKKELFSILESKDKESHEKQELNKNIAEKSGTIKVLETKAGILEKELDEMKDKESAYADQKARFQELEQKYIQCINQWKPDSCLGNTPPLSQPTDSLCDFSILPLLHNDKRVVRDYRAFPKDVPLSGTGYGYHTWKTGQTMNYYDSSKNHSLPVHLTVNQDLPVNPVGPKQLTGSMINTQLQVYPTVDSEVPFEIVVNHNPSLTMASAPNPPYSATTVSESESSSYLGTHIPSSSYEIPSRPNQPLSKCSPTPKSYGLNVSRKNSKKPKQSPMAMIKPQVRAPPAALDDEIFFVDVVDRPEPSTSIKTLSDLDDKKCITVDFAKRTPNRRAIIRHTGTNGKKKRCRQEDTVERKRTSVSMLGISSDDSEVQEIANLLKAQSRHFSKRTKSMP